jgi:Flp pilus assembly protein TadG
MSPPRPVSDRGSASAEFAIAAVLFGLLLMMGVQFALWAHATHMAQAAANTGVQTTRVLNGSAEAGNADTATMLAQLSGNVLHDPQIAVTRTTTTATVRITRNAPTILPLLPDLPVSVTVTAPCEQLP